MTAADLEVSPDEVRENRAAWLAALRSGNYPQARRTLRHNDAFCCLGVGLDVVDCDWEPVIIENDPATHRAVHSSVVGDSALTSLTRTARYRLGLVTAVPYVTVLRRYHDGPPAWIVTTLVQLNDSDRFNFAQIASVIEDQGPDWDGGGDHANLLAQARQRNRRPGRDDITIWPRSDVSS